MNLTPEQNSASTQSLYQMICLGPYSTYQAQTLSDGVFYYQIPITSNTLIIGGLEYNCSPSFFSATEKSKQKFSVTHTQQRTFYR